MMRHDITEQLKRLATEERNERTVEIDCLPTIEVLRLINDEDKKVAFAVEAELPSIARAVDGIADRLAKGGRLFYVGAGTSGRLGFVDASECPPTFGVDPSLVQAIIAGGEKAISHSSEGAEDDAGQGERDIIGRGVNAHDAVVGIAASGRTPYVIGALEAARRLGALTISLTCNRESEMAKIADIAIAPVVGPEVILGSTRMKAGTAQKMVLNMISTTVMIKLGKVYSNLMVDMRPSNAKLVDRARRLIMIATGASYAESARILEDAGLNVKRAIVMLKAGVNAEEAGKLLDAAGGNVREALIMRRR